MAIALQLSHYWVDKLADEITWCSSQRTAFKSASVRQGTALLAQAPRTAVWTGVSSNYWDGISALVKLFCSLWILVSAFVPSSQIADRSCYHLRQRKTRFFSLLWCLFAICAVNDPSQFALADGEQHLASHLNTKVNYWTHLATIPFQPLNGQKRICTSLGEFHNHRQFLWGCLTVNNNTLRRPGYGRDREDPLQSFYSHLWKLTKWQPKINCQLWLSIIQAKSCLSSWSSRFEAGGNI